MFERTSSSLTRDIIRSFTPDLNSGGLVAHNEFDWDDALQCLQIDDGKQVYRSILRQSSHSPLGCLGGQTNFFGRDCVQFPGILLKATDYRPVRLLEVTGWHFDDSLLVQHNVGSQELSEETQGIVWIRSSVEKEDKAHFWTKIVAYLLDLR